MSGSSSPKRRRVRARNSSSRRNPRRHPYRTRLLMKVITGQVVAGEDRAAALRLRLRVRQQVYVRDIAIPLPQAGAREWHNHLLGLLRRRSVTALRLTLGLVFLWFGTLKLLDSSPVTELLKHTYSFLPPDLFAPALGAWEVLVGVGLLVKRALRCTLALLCLHMTGTFVALLLAPALFFHHGNPLWLTVEGEFVMKNMVLVAAGLVIAGHDVETLGERRRADAYRVNDDARARGSALSRKGRRGDLLPADASRAEPLP